MGMWRSLHPFISEPASARQKGTSRKGRRKRNDRSAQARKALNRKTLLERFEERAMLSGAPVLISIVANSGDVLYSPSTAGQATVLHTAPRELDLTFSQGTVIDPTTLGGIQVVGAGADDALNTADDVTITPGFVGLGTTPNEVVLRFSQTLSDGAYQLTLDGSGPQALTDSNSPPDKFNSGINLQVRFDVDTGPQVLSVVPQPVTYDTASGGLVQNSNEIDVYFDKPLAPLPSTINQLDPKLFQLIYTSGTATTSDDIAINPSSVSFDATTNKATLLFQTSLSNYQTGVSGTFRLRIGNDQAVSGTTFGANPIANNVTPTVVSVPEPGSTYGDSGQPSLAPYTVDLDGVNAQPHQIIQTTLGPSNVNLNVNVPGGNTGLGVRTNPQEAHIDLSASPLGLSAFKGQPVPGQIPTYTYNFPTVYGQQGGFPLFNSITPSSPQAALAREIFQLWSNYLGVQFTETSDETLGSADFGIVTGVVQSIDPTAPATLQAAAGAAPTSPNTANGVPEYLAVMNDQTPWDNAYGGNWFQAAMQQIGRLLGLGYDGEGPPGTIMGSGGNDPATGAAPEPVFPSNTDILHGQSLYQPASDNVDMYKFTINTAGTLNAETIAQRLTDDSGNPTPSGLNTVLTLYGQSNIIQVPTIVGAGLDGSTFTLNDGIHPPVAFEFAENGHAVASGYLPIAYNTGDNANTIANDIAKAVNAAAASTGLNASATVQFTQVTLNGPLTVATTGNQGGVTYTLSRQIIARNDDYFGTDSFVNMHLVPGVYYLAVTSTGNTQFDPNVAGSGSGGTTQGPYDLKLDFTHDPATLTDAGLSLQVSAAGAAAIPAGYSFTVQDVDANGKALTKTFAFYPTALANPPAGQIPIATMSAATQLPLTQDQLSQAIANAINSAGFSPADISPSYAGGGIVLLGGGPATKISGITYGDTPIGLSGASARQPLVGNSDGTSGGAYNFWFNVGNTIFVDKAPPSGTNGTPDGSLDSPYTNLAQAMQVAADRIIAPAGSPQLAGQSFVISDGSGRPVTFEFTTNGSPVSAGAVPVPYTINDSSAQVAQDIFQAIQGNTNPLNVTPVHTSGTNIVDVQGAQFIDTRQAPALLAATKIVRVLGAAGPDNSLGVPLAATFASAPASGKVAAGQTFEITSGTVTAVFEFATLPVQLTAGKLANGNYAVAVAPNASSLDIAKAMAAAINASPLSTPAAGGLTATVSSNAAAYTNGSAWWVTLSGAGQPVINTQSTSPTEPGTPALISVSNAASYQIGQSQFGTLADGAGLTVPQGVTVMVDAGAVFKLEAANISVGVNSPNVDLSDAALQVLGTPTSSVFFTSFHDNSVGTTTDTVTSAAPGDWGGIAFGPNADLEQQGAFLDTVNYARLSYGGGPVTLSGQSVSAQFSPIDIEGSRPTITNDTIVLSRIAAISADPNSFTETIFGSPAYDPSTGAGLAVSQAFTTDYERAGPDISGDTLAITQPGGLVLTAAAGNQILPGETFSVTNATTGVTTQFEFVNRRATNYTAGQKLPDGNYAVLFSAGIPPKGNTPPTPPDTAPTVASAMILAINAAQVGVTATAGANNTQVVVSGAASIVPSTPSSFTAPAGPQLVDGETFIVTNLTTGVQTTFEFDDNGLVANGHVPVKFTINDAAATVATEMAAAIDTANIGVSAVAALSSTPTGPNEVLLNGATDFYFVLTGLTGTTNLTTIPAAAGKLIADGTTFQIVNQTTGSTTTFIYRLASDNGAAPSGEIAVTYNATDSAATVAGEVAAAINNAGLGVYAVVSGTSISLIEKTNGEFSSPLSVLSNVEANAVNGIVVRTQNPITQAAETLSAQARWTATDIPYVLSDNLQLQGNPGGPLDNTPRVSGRLEIDPGVTVKLGSARIETQMGANLIAEGTASEPIVFTSLHDNSYGGGGTFATDGVPLNTATPPTAPAPGNWAGLYFAPTSRGSLDHTLIAYAGGASAIPGGFDSFDAIEIHQATVRVADSTIEYNAAGLASTTRSDLLGNATATIYVLGAQPVIVNNVFQDNQGATISIDANSLTTAIVPDPGRSTGPISRFTQFDTNHGPLVALDQIGNVVTNTGAINGMLVRGGTLNTPSVWDDTGIVHVVQNQIQVPDADSVGGLLLESSPTASLVVKFNGANAGIMATGTPLDTANRIGGSVQVLGAPNHPVILTALSDETAGAGLTPDGRPDTYTDNGAAAIQAGLALLPTVPYVANGLTISNDVATNVVGHFEATPGPGGDLGVDGTINNPLSVTAQGQTQLLVNQNLAFEYFNFVEVNRQVIPLDSTTTAGPTLVGQDIVQSQGSFAGTNGIIGWTLTTSFKPGSTQMVNQISFTSTKPIGNLQFINYLDENVLNRTGNDLMYTQGTPGQPGFQVFTVDGAQRVGLSQSGVYSAGPQLVNAMYNGWAADSYNNLLTNIQNGTQSFSVAGVINTANLPRATDPQLGTVYGPANPTTAFAWTVNSAAMTSTITTFVNEVATPAPTGGQWQGLTFNQFSNDTNVATVNETEPAYTGGAGTNDTPATAQPLGTLAPNSLSGNDTQRLGFTVNGAISPDHPSDVDVYSFLAQPGTQVWMSLGQTSPGLDSVLELVDANGIPLARSDNAAAEAANPGLLTTSPPSGIGFAGNLAQPLAASTLLGGNYDPSNPSLSSTLYNPASLTDPGLRNLASTNQLDAGFRVILPSLPGGVNSNGFEQYYVRVRSRGSDINNLQGGLSSGDYQLQLRLQEAAQLAGSSVQYADIRSATNGITLIGLPAHSPLLGENGETSDPLATTNASLANQRSPLGTAQDLGDLLTTDNNTISVSGSLAASASNPSLSTTVDWYKFELNYDLLNAMQNSSGAASFATIFNIDYASGLSRPNATISVFDSTGKLIYIGRDSNVADNQAPPGTANPLSDLTAGSEGTGDPFIGTAQLPAGDFTYIDVEPSAIGGTAVGDTITVSYNGVDKTFEFVIVGNSLPAGDTNIPIPVNTGDTPQLIAPEVVQAINAAFGTNVASIDPTSGTRIDFVSQAAASSNGAGLTLSTSYSYYVAVSSDAVLPQALDATFNAGSSNTQVRLEPVDSVNRIAEDHIGSEGGETAQPASSLTTLFNSDGPVDFTAPNLAPSAVTGPVLLNPQQAQQVAALDTSAVPFTLGDVVLFVNQGPSTTNVPGNLETVNPSTGALESIVGALPGAANGPGNGYDDIAMRNDGQLYGLTVDTTPNTNNDANSGQYNLISAGNAAATNQGTMGIITNQNTPGGLLQQNVGVQVHAMAFVQTGITRQLFVVASYQGGNGAPAFTNGLYQLDPNTGIIVNPGNQRSNAGPGPNVLPAATLMPAGVSPPETITGLASVGGKLYAITDKGGLYIINDPGGTPSLQFVAAVKDANGNAISFTSLTNGPPDVSNGAYANDLFAVDTNGDLWAFNTSGALQDIFPGGASDVALRGANNAPLTNIVGLAFSSLDYNLWHVTDAGRILPGHGIDSSPDNSRNAQSANQPEAGNFSYYFGLGNPAAPGEVVNGQPVTNISNGVLDTAPDTSLQPGAFNYETNSQVYNTYNLPGGADGSLQASSFSLANYAAADKPTLYFNYFLDTGLGASGATFKSSARVMVSTDGGTTWSELATNDPATANYNAALDPGTNASLAARQNSQLSELPGFASASSNMPAATVGGQPVVDPRQQVQQLYDGTGVWRQARVDLSNYAGYGNILLRFDFSTAGSMNQGIPGDKFGVLNGDINGTYQTAAERGQDNAHFGFSVDDVTVGLAGRGEMVTGDTANTQYFQTPQPAASLNPPTQDLGGVGPYQLNIRGSTPYAVTVTPTAPDISLVQSFDAKDRLVDGFTIVAPAGSALVDGATFQVSDGSEHTVTFEFNNTSGPNPGVAAGNVAVNFTPSSTAAQVAAAIASAINNTTGNNKLAGVRAGTVQNVVNGVATVTGDRVDLFGATNLTSTQSLIGTLTASVASHTLLEGNQATTKVTITRSGSTAAALLVTVSATDVGGAPSTNARFVDANTLAPLGQTVTALIPVGQSSVTLTLEEIDQTYQVNGVATPLADGPQRVTITATAANYGSNADFVDVVDDDNPPVVPTLTLAVTSPANGTIVETAGANAATGTVSRNTPTNVPLTVTLTSLDPASATVPATVVIPAGATSATFPINAVNDNVLRTQPVNVALVASAVNFDPGTTSIAVQDSGNTNQVPLGTSAWQSEGPAPIVGGRTTNVATNAGAVTNPVSGAIEAVLAPPASANQPNVLFVGAVNGGVWKTTNANDPNGPTWTPLTDSMPSLSISSLQFGTTNGLVDTTKLIAGIGHSSDFADQGGTLAGLIVSTTSGASWSPVTPSVSSLATPVGQNITGVAERDNIILAAVNNGAAGGGLLRSTDGGQTFVFVPTSSGLPAGPITDLVGDPIDPKRFYAAVLGTNGGIFTSDDAGGTWSDVTPAGFRNTLNSVTTSDTIRIADNGQAVYFGYEKGGAAPNGGTALVAIYRSPATGLSSSTWSLMDLPTTNINGTSYGLNPEGGSDSNVPTALPIIHFSIVADPNNAYIVYVGGDSMNVFPNSVGSVDLTGRLFRGNAALPSGSQFTPITDNYTANHSAPHSDSRAMTFLQTGSGSELVEVDDGGVYALSNPGTSSGVWTSLVGNLDVSEMYSAAYDTNTDTVIGATQDTGTAEQQTPGGGTWTEVNKNNGGVVAVDDITDAALGESIRYTSSAQLGELNGNDDFIASTYDANNNLITSTKPALLVQVQAPQQTLYQVEPNLPYVTTLVLNAVNPKQMVIGGANSVYESLDGGQTLTALGIGGSSDPLFGAAMAYGGYLNGVANPGVLWIGANTNNGNAANPLVGQVYLRTTAGGAFTTTNYSSSSFTPAGSTTPIVPGAVRALAIDPNNWQIAVVVDNNGQVWYTTNEGQTFTNITANLLGLNGQPADLHSVAFVPSETTSLIYVGTQDGVYQYQTANPAAGWSRYGASLPDVPVFSLEYVPSQQLLVAGTLGRGAFVISAIGAAGDVSITLNQQTVSDDYDAATGTGLITGTITRSGTFGDLPVLIQSSNPAVVPSTTVTIPDGQGTVNFSIPVTDEVDANGNEIAIPRQTVILTPQAGGLNPIGTYVNISDDNLPTSDDTPALTVTLPTNEMNPAQGSTQITGTVSVNFPVTQDLTVTLLSSDPGRGSVVQANGTNTVVIKAGTTSATFTLSAVDQFINDGQPQWVTVTATATTYQGLSVTSDPGDGNDDEGAETTPDSDDSFTVKIDATQHLLSYNRVGDASVPRQQGQIVIQDNRISNSLDYAIVAEAAPRSGLGSTPSPGVPINFQPLNTDRVAPGVTITSNLLVGNGQGGIDLVGDTNNSPASAVPIARVLNNTVYGASTPMGVGVNVGPDVSPTILNNIFANLATGVSVDPTSPSTVLEGSVYQNNGADLSGTVAGGVDTNSYHLQPTDPLFANAAAGDFYLARGSQAIDSAINQLSQRPDLTTAESLIGIPASSTVAPAYDLNGQLRTGDMEVNPSGVGSTLFKDRGAIERVDFSGPTATLITPAANGAANLSAIEGVVHWIGGPVQEFAIQLSDVGVGVDNSTVTSSKFALYENGARLTAGVDYFFQYDTNTDTVYLKPATKVWNAGNQYTIFVDNGVEFDALGSGTQGGIKDLAGNDLQANRGTGSVDAGYTEFDILLQSTAGDAPTVGVPSNQSVPENGAAKGFQTSLVFSSLNTPPNPITLYNVDAPGDTVTAVFTAADGTLVVPSVTGSGGTVSMTFSDGGAVTVQGSGSSTVTMTGTVADITQVLSGAAAQGGLPAVNGLTFIPNVDYSGPASITIDVTDPLLGNGGLTGQGKLIIQVTAVNQPPAVNLPAGPQSIDENASSPLVFSAASGNPITISDPDGYNGVETVTIDTSNGSIFTGTVSLYPSQLAGLSFTQGNGTGNSQMTFSGTLAQINDALNGMTFAPADSFSGTAEINFTVNDNGNSLGETGNVTIKGTPQTSSAKELINVGHVNQAPQVGNIPTVVVNEMSTVDVVTIDLSRYITNPDQATNPSELPPSLTVYGDSNPALVTATINGQILTLTIPAYANGGATIQIQATNDNPGPVHPSTTAYVNLTVNPVPFPPSVVTQQYIYTPGQVLSVTAPGLLMGDVGHNGAPLFVQAVNNRQVYGQQLVVGTGPANGNGSFVYIPQGNNAFDAFSVWITDDSTDLNVPASHKTLETVNIINSADRLQGEWVTRMYTQVLGRTQEPQIDTYVSDVNSLIGELNAGVSLSQIAYDFVHSPEYYATNVIEPAYLKLLGRPADAQGVAYWTAQMENGLTDQGLQAAFVASDEFYANAGGTNLSWINAIYEKLLGRAADAKGLAFWEGQLGTGVPRGEVALQIANSAENDTQLITADYEKFLGRAPDPNGLNFWQQQFADGKTNEDVVAGFTGSSEYYNDGGLT